jgi:hypothetical protein
MTTEIEVQLDESNKGDSLWVLRPIPACPTGNRIQSCMGGAYNSHGEPYIQFVCRFTNADYVRSVREGKHFQPCHWTPAGAEGMGCGNQGVFGSATVRHATSEEMAAARAQPGE